MVQIGLHSTLWKCTYAYISMAGTIDPFYCYILLFSIRWFIGHLSQQVQNYPETSTYHKTYGTEGKHPHIGICSIIDPAR